MMAMDLLTMPALHVGHGTHVGGLSVFPIWTDAPTVSGLDTGIAAHVQVDEREGSPVVGELVLKNQGAKSFKRRSAASVFAHLGIRWVSEDGAWRLPPCGAVGITAFMAVRMSLADDELVDADEA